MSAKPGIRSPRGRYGTTATTLALLGLLACAFGAIEAISLAVHRRTLWFGATSIRNYGSRTHFDDNVVLIVGLALTVLGVLLLLRAAIPAGRHAIELSVDSPLVAIAVTPQSLRRSLGARIRDFDGVSSVRTGARRRRITITATTTLRDATGLQERLQGAAESTLAGLDPIPAQRIRIKLRRKDR